MKTIVVNLLGAAGSAPAAGLAASPAHLHALIPSEYTYPPAPAALLSAVCARAVTSAAAAGSKPLPNR